MNLNGRFASLRIVPRLVAVFTGLTVVAGPASAQIAREPNDPLDALVVVDPRLQPSSAGVPLDGAAAELPSAVRAGWQGFLATAGGPWKAHVDRRTGRIDFAEGAGVPWIPGAGNALANDGPEPDLPALERIARAFLPRVATVLGIDPAALSLSQGRSGRTDVHLWNVDFDVIVDGLPVEGARVVFRVNNGNLIQFGTENLPSPGSRVPPGKVSRKEALSTLSSYVGSIGGIGAADRFVDGGTVKLLPARVQEGQERRGLVRVWEIVFRRRGSIGTWRARVDATSGEFLDFRDVNDYARATGGVYPSSYHFNDETVLPMPFADLSTGGFADSAGNFSPAGGAVTSTLTGKYVDVNDGCGAISLSSNALGNLVFGTSAGTDCSTPGTGGAGNTHASRTQFYHVNRIMEVGRGWLPANGWLQGQLPVNVNIPSVCNAYWNGFSINFFRSGAGCGNTGEIAGVSLHEYGHGLDQNDGTPSPDKGSGEAYADITAALLLHDSCMGPGFFQGSNCSAYGDPCTSCSGVRDVDWAKHASNAPHTVDNFTRTLCYSSSYSGPCGREGHCESYLISEAVWDLANRDLPDPGSAGAWAITERLWYLSRPTAGSAFVCHNATTPWTSDGCAAGSLFRTLRAADDDDGNLANGTPHSCQIFAALDRHGLACAGDAGANVCFSGCAPPAVPTLGLTAGNRHVVLNWSGSTPGAEVDVFRSEAGCDAGFQRVASGLTGTSFTDTAVANGMTYSYRLVAHGAGNAACSAPPTECQSATPQEPPCNTPPPAPAGLTATTQGIDRISLSWGAVAGAVEYRVFRSASAGGPFTSIASVAAPNTTYVDASLDQNTTRYYVVQAATGDACVSADSNVASATTLQCQAQTLYQNGFESATGLAGWTRVPLGGPDENWRGVQACLAHGGSRIFRFGGETCGDIYAGYEHAAVRPQADIGDMGFSIPAGAALNRLTFWHRRDFEDGYDGGTLKLSLDGGPWVQVPGSALSGETYNYNLYQYCPPAGTAGSPVFSGWRPDFAQTVVNLDAACAAAGSLLGCGGHTIRLQFEAITDCIYAYTGWFLDDVSVTTCVPHGCTGAPVIGAAATPAANQVQVSWSNGAPASTSFNVYRALGTCAAPGPFTLIAGGVSGSPYLDSPVSGGVTWAYRVAGLDATGVCESDLSGCAQASPLGACTLAPTFAGAAQVDDQVTSTCALAVSWAPATAHCGGPVTYDVFRSTSPDFVPSAANRVATGVTGTSFQDSGTLSYGTTYSYVVRAVDSATGQSDANTARLSGTPTGLLILPVTLADTFEAADGFDLDDWSHAVLSGSKDWELSQAAAHSGTHSWHAGGAGFTAQRVLISPPIEAGPATVLSFWHTFQFESCFDGGILEISSDADAGAWTQVTADAFLAGGYNAQIYNSGNPLGGRYAWCQGTIGPMTQVRVSLAAWAGHEVRVRWHMGEDSSTALEGWYVDSVTFEDAVVDNACRTAPPPALDFHTATPCRLVDTRAATGPNGGPALQPGQVRTFLLAGSCGIPPAAGALSLNVTVVNTASAGDLILFPADQGAPLASSISFRAGQTRANNALVLLSAGGGIKVLSNTSAPFDLVLDVNGWFQE